jgi:flagellar FliJ protein
MRDFQTFLAKLGEALSQQRELVVLAQQALEAERNHWREAAQRAHVVETLAERWQTEESRAESRRDQIESDELSNQRARNRDRTP